MRNDAPVDHHAARRSKGTETRFDRWLRSARQGLEGVLFVMSKEVHGHKNWSVFGMWFDFFQLMAYPLYQGKQFPWQKMGVMQWVIQLLGSLNPSVAADSISPLFKLFTVFGAAAWVAAIIAAAAYSAYAFSVGNFATVAPLKFLRATARLTTAVLFVPLASLLISAYKCKTGGKWSVTEIPCYGTEHSLLMALVSVLLPFFWLFSLCVSAVFFDRNYRSSNIVARVHGRVGIAMISVKSLLTLVFTVAGDADPWLLHIFVIAVGFFWLYLWIGFLPNLTQWYNRTWASFGAVFTWAALCAALARTLDDPKSGVAGYVFLIGVPTAAYTGYALAYMRFQSYGRVGTAGGVTMRNAYDVELRARWLMRDIMAAAQGSDDAHGPKKIKARASSRPPARAKSQTVHRQGRSPGPSGRTGRHTPTRTKSADGRSTTGALGSPAGGGDLGRSTRSIRVGDSMTLSPGSHTPGHGDTMRTTTRSLQETGTRDFAATSTSRGGEAGAGHDGEPSTSGRDVASVDGQAYEAKQAQSKEAIIRQVAQLYSDASSAMPGSSVLALFYAQFIRVFVGDRDLELAIINGGLEKDPSIDIRFLLFQSRKQLEETPQGEAPPGAPNAHDGHDGHGGGGHDGHGGGGGHDHGGGGHKHGHAKLSLIERVQYEKLQSESVEFDMKARQAEYHFWMQLRSVRPSLQRLHVLAEEMSDAITACTIAYERMLVMRPDSVEVLNSYAVFLLEVKRETVSANRHFDAADELLAKHEAAEEAGRLRAEAAAVAAQAASDALVKRHGNMLAALPGGGSRQGGRSIGVAGLFSVAAAASKFKSLAHNHGAATGGRGFSLPSHLAQSSASAAPGSMGADGQLHNAHGGVLFALNAARRAADAAKATATAQAAHVASSHHDHASRQDARVGHAGPSAGAALPALSYSPAVHHDGGVMSAPHSSRHNEHGTSHGTPHLTPRVSVPGALPTPRIAGSSAADGGAGHAHEGGDGDVLGKGKNRRGSDAITAYAGAIAKMRRASLVASAAAEIASGRRVTEKGAANRRASIDANTLWNVGSPRSTQDSGAGDGSSRSDLSKHTPRASGQSEGVGIGIDQYRSPAVAAAVLSGRRAASQPPAPYNNRGPTTAKLHPAAFSLPAKKAVMSDVTVESEDDRLSDDELVALRRMAGVSDRAKADARARQKDAAESAASSLRMAIKEKAGVVEPSLLVLKRALTVLFGIAMVLNIVGAVVQRSLLVAFSKDMDLLSSAVERQLVSEDVVRHTHNLALMSAGVLPLYGAGSGGSALLSANATYAALSKASTRMDALHRALFISSSSSAASPEEKELYNRALLTVYDYAAPTAGNPAGGSVSRSVSLSNLGVEFVSKAAIVAGTLLPNVTAGAVIGLDAPSSYYGGVNPSVWFVLVNGPGTLRSALNASTLDLSTRADNHEALLRTVDFALAIASAVLTCCIALAVVLPIVSAVKSSTDEIFAIFLALPDSILKQMQRTCKQQIGALEKLIAATNADVAADAVLAIAMQDKEEQDEQDAIEDKRLARQSSHDSGLKVSHRDVTVETSAPDVKAPSHAGGGDSEYDHHVTRVDTDDDNQSEVSKVEAGFGESTSLLENAPVPSRLHGGGDVTAGVYVAGGAPAHRSTSEQFAEAAVEKAIKLTRAASSARMLESSGRRRGAGTTQAGGPSFQGGGSLGHPPSLLEMQSTRETAALIRQMSHALMPGLVAPDEDREKPLARVPPPLSKTGNFAESFLGQLGQLGKSFVVRRKRKENKNRVGVTQRDTAAARQFDSSILMLLKLTARFVWPLVLLGVYYGGLWAYEESTTASLSMLTRTATYFGQVHVLLAHVHHGVRFALASAPPVVPPAASFACNGTTLALSLASTESLSATANGYQDALLFGNPKLGFPSPALSLDPALLRIMLRDGCTGVPGMPPDCGSRTGFYHGLVGDGIQPALREFMSLARFALQLRQDALTQALRGAGGNVAACPAGPSLVSSPLTDLDGLSNSYLRAAFNRVLDLVLGLAREQVSSFVTNHAAIASVTIILLLLLYTFWVLRSISKMDRDIKRTRGTLLLFPTDVLAGVATFVQLSGGLGSGGAVRAMQNAELSRRILTSREEGMQGGAGGGSEGSYSAAPPRAHRDDRTHRPGPGQGKDGEVTPRTAAFTKFAGVETPTGKAAMARGMSVKRGLA